MKGGGSMARFPEIPEVSFMGDITLSGTKRKALEYYNEEYKKITGKNDGISDQNKAILYSAAQIFYQIAAAINEKGKQNLLKYATGEYLDNLAPERIRRKQAENAVVTVRFNLSAARNHKVAIPQGTRITSQSGKLYFATEVYAEILPGEEYVDVRCVSAGRATQYNGSTTDIKYTGGTVFNNFEIGELNVLVDPIAYIKSVENIERPSGGTDVESDDDLAQRIYDSRYLYSTTGAEAAYIYYIKSYSTLIDDVVVTNPQDADINFYIATKDREAASETFLNGARDYLYDKNIRPMTDRISVYNAKQIKYKINVEYTVYESNISRLSEIQKSIEAAVEEYKTWQSEKIGRDINSQKLISLMVAAGAAKVEVIEPKDTRVLPEEIAYCIETEATYTGFIEV